MQLCLYSTFVKLYGPLEAPHAHIVSVCYDVAFEGDGSSAIYCD